MAKKQTSSLNGEMQTRSHCTAHRMADNKRRRSSNVGEKGELSMVHWPLWKTVQLFLMKSNVHLPYESAMSLFCLCLREINAFSHSYLYRNVHNSFIRNSWRLVQLRYPSTGERMNKSWCIYAVGYHAVIRKNKWPINPTTGVHFKNTNFWKKEVNWKRASMTIYMTVKLRIVKKMSFWKQ